jgi:hypothetical protein
MQGSRYCTSCGAQQGHAAPAQQRRPALGAGTCRVCRMPVVIGLKRCSRCGAKDPALSNRARSYLFLAVLMAVVALVAYSNLNDDPEDASSSRSADPSASAPAPAPAPVVGQPLAAADAECTSAAPDLLERVEAAPDSSVLVLDLPHGRLVPAPGGVVLLAEANFEDEYGVRDPALGEWFIAEDGSITSFDEVAEGVTAWPRHDYSSITTGTTMVVADCASQITLTW